ncbi:MAG: RuBisCO large subunit C-terminal-like domain-containing protein [Acidobacteriota bacterium]|nr:RuBisCO large subunit C-terminal-like domain-containing protein [Acidobacteriota bacterium]
MASAQAGPDRVTAVYRVQPGAVAPEERARLIAVEQTVEIPEALIPPHIESEIVGRVESVTPDPEAPGASRVTISYGAELAANLFDLLAVAIGNAPMYGGVRLVGLEPPRTLLETLPGPNHGVEGVRRMCGVLGRPLLATALKPQGSSVSELASMGEAFARGGGDLVKDDNNITDDFEGFRDRVTACAEAVERGNQATGRRCLYLPHAGARAEELERYVAFVAEAGLPGVLICPMITGLDTMRALAERYPLVFMAHPSLTGVYTHAPQNGVAHGVLFGTLFRLAGADISVFPDARGRFQFTRAQCGEITERLREPLGALRSAWPAPTGGIGPTDVAQVCGIYGPDIVLLIGGALLGHPEGIEAGTREVLDRIREVHPDVSVQPSDPSRPSLPEPRRLAFRRDWNWEGRHSSPYKDAGDLTFRGVRRVELVGKFSERTRCDLRYFEVEPGGHTSFEKHLHTHVVIGARGEGVLVLGDRRLPLRHLDVACVGPLETHQLRNETEEPFGFFCVVDHDRDRPMRAE